VTYRIDGRIVTLRSIGPWAASDRDRLFEEICGDVDVPGGAGLLLDARVTLPVDTVEDMVQALEAMQRLLGHRLSPYCAVVINLRTSGLAHTFQSVGRRYGLRVGLFFNDVMARQWLAARESSFGDEPVPISLAA
jgi:hypothetical protein